MTFGQIQWIKRLLGVSLVGFTALVAHEIYEGRKGKKAEVPPPVVAGASDSVTRQVQHRTLDREGRTVFELLAAERAGGTGDVQTFKNVEIYFEAGKEKKPLKITSDTCRVNVRTRAAHLEGHVVVSDEKSLRIETDTLDYRPEPGEVVTESPVKIFRPGLEGTAGGLRYETEGGAIQLLNDVWFRLTPKTGAPTEIVSKAAEIHRRESLIRFMDDVVVSGEGRRLACHDLQLYLNEDESGLDHAQAYEGVEVVLTTPRTSGPTTSRMKEPGRKRLTSKALEMEFRPDGSMERLRALDGAELLLEAPPAGSLPPGEVPMTRRIQGNLLAFELDPRGHLTDLRGRGGVTLTLEPVGGPASEIRRVDARQFESTFDPETSELAEARCSQAVQFSKGELHAEAESGVYRARHNRLNLTGAPRLWDGRATLEANQIDLDVVSGDLDASGSVRSTQKAAGAGGALGFLPASSGESTYVVANELSYERVKDVATYSGSVRAIRGENQIQAEKMVLRQTEGELEAMDAVRTSLLQPKNDAPPERFQATSGKFLYSSKDGVLRYREGVELVTPQMKLKGQRVYLTPGAKEGELEKIQASLKVEVELKDSRVRGDEVTYLTKSRKMEVSGDKAVMQDGDKLTEGKELTFFLADDRILVDGRAESRTKTVYTSKPRQ